MITEYGHDVFFTVVVVCCVVIGGSLIFIASPLIKYLAVAIALAIFLFTLNFFRDPERQTPAGSDLVISPADGTVVVIKKVNEELYCRDTTVQISIFMSPLNVHVNRIPLSGTVGYYKHVKGRYFAAYEDKASLDNEQTHIGIESGKFRVFFKQIAGFVARRIVCTLNVGDEVVAGRRFGMIKFGSRVDVFVPKNSDIKVTMGQKTVAGESVLAVIH